MARMQSEMATDPRTRAEALERLWVIAPHLRELIAKNPACPHQLHQRSQQQPLRTRPDDRAEHRRRVRHGLWLTFVALMVVAVLAVTTVFLFSWFSPVPQSATSSAPQAGYDTVGPVDVTAITGFLAAG